MAGERASGGPGSGGGAVSGVRGARLDLLETSLAWANDASSDAEAAKTKLEC